MSDFERFNEIDPPDQWNEIVERAAAASAPVSEPDPDQPFRWRAMLATAAVGVLVVAGVVALNGRGDDRVQTLPVTTTDSTTPIARPASSDVASPSPATGPATGAPPVSEPHSTTSADRPMSCFDQGLDAILDVVRSGPIPLDVDRVPTLEALVTLTDRTVVGSITSVVRESDEFSDWTTLDVEITETVAGPPVDEVVDRISFASSGSISADAAGAVDPLASPVSISGVRFVAVLDRFSDAPGGWATRMQGLSIACDDTSPLTGVLAPLPQAGTASIVDVVEDVRAMDRTVSTTPAPVTRPVVDAAICGPPSILTGTIDGETDETPLRFFAKPSEFPVPIQVFADPDLGAAGPIVMVMRFRDRDDIVSGVEPFGEQSIRVRIFDNGVGEGTWTAADGTTGYLRSRGVDEVEGLGKLIAFATPRDPDAPIPGFDYFTDDDRASYYSIDGQLQLLHEGMNTDLAGSWSTSECEVASTGFVYRISRLSGDPVLRFGAVLDRPPPLEVGVSGDSVIMINGIADDAAPTVADVREATDDEWAELDGGG